jgi:hypothetical protein
MKVKNSVVKSVQKNGTWTSKKDGKIFYKNEIQMDNGDVGEYSSIKEDQDKFIEGESVEYQYLEGDFPKIKPNYSKGFTDNFNDKKGEDIFRSVALKSAIEYGVASSLELEDIFNVADKMDSWLNKAPVATNTNKKDDLPF